MKIAIIKHSVTITPFGGVKVQAEMWKKGLEKLGHHVELINIWKTNNWKEYDYIIILEFSLNMRGYVNFLYSINPNIVLAPIIDTLVPAWKVGITSRNKLFKLLGRFINARFSLIEIQEVKDKIKLFLVRSDYEKSYLTAIGIPERKISLVPLNYRITPPIQMPIKQKYVFLACLLADERKNVARLIYAAKKYNFKLVLAGNIRNNREKKWLDNLIENEGNISYLGRLTDEELFKQYSNAKVFALPSINEGVGMVALEAAAYGCEIVLTNLGAPKEYYGGMAHLVNPYSVDDIGKTIISVLNEERHHQPELREYIINNYSEEICMKKLENSLNLISNE